LPILTPFGALQLSYPVAAALYMDIAIPSVRLSVCLCQCHMQLVQ